MSPTDAIYRSVAIVIVVVLVNMVMQIKGTRIIPVLSVLLIMIYAVHPLIAQEIEKRVVYLRNGEILYGRIVTQSASKIWLRTRKNVLVIPKENIRRIVYNTPREQEFIRTFDQERKRHAHVLKKRLEEQRKMDRTEWEAEFSRRLKTRQEVEEFKRMTREEQIAWSSLWRSALIPGWGQYYRGEHIKGSIFAGLFLVSGLIWRKMDNDFKAVSDEFNSNTPLLAASLLTSPSAAKIILVMSLTDDIRVRKQAASNRAAMTGSIFAGLYVINLIDAFSFSGTVLLISVGGDGEGGYPPRSGLHWESRFRFRF